jgi:hypothetical protein
MEEYDRNLLDLCNAPFLHNFTIIGVNAALDLPNSVSNYCLVCPHFAFLGCLIEHKFDKTTPTATDKFSESTNASPPGMNMVSVHRSAIDFFMPFPSEPTTNRVLVEDSISFGPFAQSFALLLSGVLIPITIHPFSRDFYYIM